MDESNASLRNMSPEKMRDCAILALWYGKPDTSLDALSDIVRALTGASEDELRGELSHIARALKGATEEDILEMRRYGDQMEMRELITEHNQPFKPRLIGYLYCFATQSHEPVSVDEIGRAHV